MIERQFAQQIGFDQGIGWTFDCALMPQAMQQAAAQRRFATAQITAQEQNPRSDHLGKHPAQSQRCHFIGQQQRQNGG